MTNFKKRNIVIGILCGILLLMVVGYAAFNTVLNINGTTSISSNWNILITNVEEKNKVGEASTVDTYPKWENLTAEFKTNLVSPGDSIEYEVTIENQGNLNAELARIKVSENDNPAIKFTTSGLEEGDILEASNKAILTVKVEYSDEVTSQPDNLTANLEVTLDYVEEGKKSEWSPAEEPASEMLIKKVTTSGDGLYSDTYESGRYVYKGANPNNYLTFNNEQAGWRIVSVESDGTIKIMHNGIKENKQYDSSGANGRRTSGYCALGNAKLYGCDVWAATSSYVGVDSNFSGPVPTDSDLKTYLNSEYYSKLEQSAKDKIQNHVWYYGSVTWNNSNLASQLLEEKKYWVNANVGIIQLSDYIKANSNTGSCGNFNLTNQNHSICSSTNFMAISTKYWIMNAPGTYGYSTGSTSYVDADNSLQFYRAHELYGVVPVIYLQANVTLSGSGTLAKPYILTN